MRAERGERAGDPRRLDAVQRKQPGGGAEQPRRRPFRRTARALPPLDRPGERRGDAGGGEGQRQRPLPELQHAKRRRRQRRGRRAPGASAAGRAATAPRRRRSRRRRSPDRPGRASPCPGRDRRRPRASAASAGTATSGSPRIVVGELQRADGEDEDQQRPRPGQQGDERLADRRVDVDGDRQDVAPRSRETRPGRWRHRRGRAPSRRNTRPP